MEKTLPVHVAIIMDGNGRWAKKQGKKRIYGHKHGAENVRRIIKHATKKGIKYLTLYTFSTENWNRPSIEVSALMSMFSRLLDSEIEKLHKNDVKVVFNGRRSKLKAQLLKKMKWAEELTVNNKRIVLILAIDYGGRQEIVDACKKIIKAGISPNRLDEQLFRKYMYLPDIPDVDLLIRTAGEYRISNFLLWQTAYSELYISKLLWPEFNEEAFDRAINSYLKRERKFGKIIKT